MIDPEDPVLGFVVEQVRALSADGEVVVIANEARNVPPDLDRMVLSLGKERGYGRTRRTLRYVTLLGKLAATGRAEALVAHMCPAYLVLAAPVTKVARMRTALWFVHPADSRMLRLAERLADVVVTAFPGSYPRGGPKVVPIGHAIDTERIPVVPVTRAAGDALRLLALGRTSPVKRYDVLIDATTRARRAGADVALRIVGPSVTPGEVTHRAELIALAAGSNGAVIIDDGVARGDVGRVIAGSHVLVNTTQHGSADKVVFEAMAAERPVLVTSPAFSPLVRDLPLPLLCHSGDPTVLAEQIGVLASAPSSVLDDIGRELRSRVEREHSLDHWAHALRRVLDDLGPRAPHRVTFGRRWAGRSRAERSEQPQHRGR